LREVYLVGGLRTPIGKMGGAFKDVEAQDLLAPLFSELLLRLSLDGASVDEVVVGQTKQSSDAPNIARVVSLMAGLPESVPGYTVHRQCGSGMQALMEAAMAIRSGFAEVVLCGGVESMSTAPYYLRKARFGYLSGNGELVDPNTESQPRSQPESIYGRFNMGVTAENLAERYGISRLEQDEFALESHGKAISARKEGLFEEEILPFKLRSGREERVIYSDEGPREDTSLEKLSKLPPVFKEGGTVTAGNSSSRSDGAVACLVASSEACSRLGLNPLARLLSFGVAGVDPRFMGIGPVPASRRALSGAGLSLDEVGLFEVNEAFAAQTLAVIREMGLRRELVNVKGGAIALGHPLGASGLRIALTLALEMRRRGVRFGLATICVAGGMGMSAVLELV